MRRLTRGVQHDRAKLRAVFLSTSGLTTGLIGPILQNAGNFLKCAHLNYSYFNDFVFLSRFYRFFVVCSRWKKKFNRGFSPRQVSLILEVTATSFVMASA